MSSPGASAAYEPPGFVGSAAAAIGVPPGVIGTAMEGPAFVPISFGSIDDFVSKFGVISGSHVGTLAVDQWLKNQSSITYLRILGIGNGRKRLSVGSTNSSGQNIPAGGVKEAGFVVGGQQVKSNGMLGDNPYAIKGGPLGRTYFLGAFMSESAGSTYLSDAGIQVKGANIAAPILRGVLFTPSGVIASLSGCYTANASTASSGPAAGTYAAKFDGGGTVGSIDINASNYNFVLLLNGHIHTEKYPSVITASLNKATKDSSGADIYITSSLNQDPTKIQQAGHYLYASYDLTTAQAEITGSGIITPGTEKTSIYGEYLQESIFLVTSSVARNIADYPPGSLKIPNFENFNDRYEHAFSPMVISQKINRLSQNLFSIHVLDDGAIGNQQLKITIENMEPASIDGEYGTFDLLVRKFWDDDLDVELLGEERFTALNLNPNSDNYIARRIGDRHKYYDFDRKVESQRMVLKGDYPNRSSYIRVEMDPNVDRKNVSNKLLPVGFRGPYHLVTSGSSIMSLPQHPLTDGSVIPASTEWSQRLVEPPIPYRKNLSRLGESGAATSKIVNSDYCWGFKTEEVISTTDPNLSNDSNISAQSFCKYYPKFSTLRASPFVGANHDTPDSDGTIYDSDRFNNNMFSLENVQIHTRSDVDIIDTSEWAYANYRRNGILVRQIKSNGTYDTGRFLNVAKDFSEVGVKSFLSFTMPVQAGFDGSNIFETEKSSFTNAAATWELENTRQAGTSGPTISAFKRALTIMSEKTETDIKLLAMPGVRVPYLTDMAVEVAENHFSALYIMDLQEFDIYNNVVTSSDQIISIENTVDAFTNRVIDSSFVSTYFPDVSVAAEPQSVTNRSRVFAPPSIGVLGAYANNDKVGGPWTAPSGYVRGTLLDVTELKVKYLSGSATAVEELFNVGINPIIADTGGIVIYGQKTLMPTEVDSALQRINIRRLLIEMRSIIRKIAKYYIFEQNVEQTLASFERAANQAMGSLAAAGAITRYKVKVDKETTSIDDVNDNIVRGKIYFQPVGSADFVSADFDTE